MLLQLEELKTRTVEQAPVSIPQAVSAVATKNFCKYPLKIVRDVSIPQAVSAVATESCAKRLSSPLYRFNTASGKCCCNIKGTSKLTSMVRYVFQYRKR